MSTFEVFACRFVPVFRQRGTLVMPKLSIHKPSIHKPCADQHQRLAVLFSTIFFFLSLSLPSAAQAKPSAQTEPESVLDLLVLVSNRSAPTMVAGAHQVLSNNAGVSLAIRTVNQLTNLDDKQLQDLLSRSENVAVVAVFGDSVERLLALKYPAKQSRFILHSDRRLLSLSTNSKGQAYQARIPEVLLNGSEPLASNADLAKQQAAFPQYADWLQARSYWINRSADNAANLIELLVTGNKAPVKEVSALRFALHGAEGKPSWLKEKALDSALDIGKPVVWLLDHNTGDLGDEWQLHQSFCAQINAQCISVLAAWGEPSVEAVRTMKRVMASKQNTPWAVVSIQDFVIGGGDGREAVDELLATMNVPVLKGLRLSNWTAADHLLSAEGIPKNTVHYRLAMPELQGVSQAQILALAAPSQTDPATGAQLSRSIPQQKQIQRQVQRLEKWLALQQKTNAEKRVAIVYYNHPPGRHNIGADNLNVPDSLLEILRAMKAAGYKTGDLPEDRESLLDLLQETGVNLPEDAKALAAMSKKVATLSPEDYLRWFERLPPLVQAEMVNGPLAALHHKLELAIEQSLQLDNASLRQARLDRLQGYMLNTISDLHHALDGLRHKGRDRALNLLDQLEVVYQSNIDLAKQGKQITWPQAEAIKDALLLMQIEGIRGWGEAPGKVMVWNKAMLIPGLQFGNVFIGPQPPRGWEINEELLHANLSFPPPHQYLGFYHYIQHQFNADAVVHIGRHSTYEFLPKRSLGLDDTDYPSIVAGDLPGIYPYIVDGVGEGIQAKRRGLAVMVDHLTPPLAATELYDNLLHLRQLIESAEAASDEATHLRAIKTLREDIDRLGLREELIASMDEELQVRGVGFDAIDEHFLLHEVGHYLTNIQESFMPLGLHVFGRNWSDKAIDIMLASMTDKADIEKAQKDRWQRNLSRSPAAEMQALLNGLNGGFVLPGKGNDPIRTPEALPTGRNFFALDGSLLPTRVGFDIGRQLAEEVLSKPAAEKTDGDKQGVILWASDAVRDEGAMIAFGMKLLGVRPIWNSRGIIKGLERLPLDEQQAKRLDVVFTTSGLFRDLYGEHLVLLDKASLLALDASADLIKSNYPALARALDLALAPLGEWRQGGNESLEVNRVAFNWLSEARAMLAAQPDIQADVLGRQSSLRVFGIAPGSYGAGINRLVERSSAWQDRSELADVFIKRMGHAYGVGLNGESSQQVFEQQLAKVSHTFLGRASNLYGLIDNNDAFDYLGGFNLAVEQVSGEQPNSSVINHADNNNLHIDNLSSALLGELRGRFLNPQWIKPLMDEGYAGARTMGSEFIEYLWGWQVTSPDIINDTVWEQVKAVYVDDSLDLGLDDFLSESHQRHVQTNILAVMLVAIDKGFWQADDANLQQLAQQFAENIVEIGIPGSGHTHPNHPMYDLVKSQLSEAEAEALEQVLQQSRVQDSASAGAAPELVSHIQELELDKVQEAPKTQAGSAQADSKQTASQDSDAAETTAQQDPWLKWLLVAVLLLVVGGVIRGRRLGVN